MRKKMNKELYESLVKSIASSIKKAINESLDDSTPIIPNEYYDENGDVDLSDISSLPKEIIDALVKDLLKNGDLQKDDWEDDCLMLSIQPDTKSDNATVLTRSLADYEICLAFNADIDCYVDYIPGSPSYDRDVPDDPDETECKIDGISIDGLMLTDGDQELMIEDSDINAQVKDIVEYSDILEEFQMDKVENYDPRDYDPYDYEED